MISSRNPNTRKRACSASVSSDGRPAAKTLVSTVMISSIKYPHSLFLSKEGIPKTQAGYGGVGGGGGGWLSKIQKFQTMCY